MTTIMALFLTLSGLLQSCITIAITDPSMGFKEIPADVEPLVDQFIKDYEFFAKANYTPYRGLSKESLVIRIQNIQSPKSTIGLCLTGPGDFKFIVLDSEFWYDASELEKEEVLYHELGHCLLGQDHREEEVEGGEGFNVKLSMMSSVILPTYIYAQRRGHYKYELFNGKKGVYGRCENLGFQRIQTKNARKSNP